MIDSPLGRTVYVAREHGQVQIPMTDLLVGDQLDVYPEVIKRDYFTLARQGNRLILRAGGYLGLIPINDRIVVDVRPKVPIRNLERVFDYARGTPIPLLPHLRLYARHDEPAPSLLDLLTDALLDAVEEVGARGLHREYRENGTDTSFPRGRILMGQTTGRLLSRGVRHRVAATWHEQTVDTAPNRCLKFAIWYVAGRYARMRPLPEGAVRRLTRLNKALRLFDGSELDRERRFMHDPLVSDGTRMPSVRAYYRRALTIATTMIQDRGVTFADRGDDILIASFVINMAEVFEEYLRAVLRARLVGPARDIEVLDGNKKPPGGGSKLLFDAPPSDPATPDIVLRRSEGTRAQYPMLLEAKYKVLRTEHMPLRDDINQIITYAVSYRAPLVVLVHPRVAGSSRGMFALGTIGSTILLRYVYDLAATDLDAEEVSFAQAVRRALDSGYSPSNAQAG